MYHCQLLCARALIHSIRRAMHLRGLLAADIFRAFDAQARGCLTQPDLAAGLQRLGLQLSAAQVGVPPFRWGPGVLCGDLLDTK